MLRLGVILGTTRPGRRGPLVAPWVVDVGREHQLVRAGTAEIEFLDLAEFGLPLLEEPFPAKFGRYQQDSTRRWAARIDALDGFVFVTPEYNHSIPAALKNAVDHLYAEWGDKAAGIVSYGVNGGIRGAEHLRHVLAELKVAAVRSQPALSVFDDFVITDPLAAGEFRPRDNQREAVASMFDEVVTWAQALRPVRTAAVATAGTSVSA
ncbi:NADPH-dependent FMN reductase [Amycolatopsis sp. cmx-4-83]|uniref:NADPH-dependent FMN reductase n=1 Tax=Amycolatopsis sp. cmx-4-83 TaxID=2790940 RepID=UPI00397A3333